MSRSFPRVAVIGAGDRGNRYADILSNRGAVIVAVAEPNDTRRQAFMDRHSIMATGAVASWESLDLSRGQIDGIVIATRDDLHVDPALRFAMLRVPMLLEKPIGHTWSECQRLFDGLPDDPTPILVAHVLRYAPYTARLNELIADGVLGEIINVHHIEPVGFWHFSHSYARGRWRSTRSAAPLIVSKACHDVDWVMSLISDEVTAVSSFGSLRYFVNGSKPPGAAARCVDCSIDCAYDAKAIYLAAADRGEFGHPVSTITESRTRDGVLEALETGPYGICVYDSDNNVMDNQVSNLFFKGGQTATITVSAFSELRSRHTVLGGTRAEAIVTTSGIEVYSFYDRKRKRYTVATSGHDIASGHAGGDEGVVGAFMAQMREPSDKGLHSFSEALRTHRVGFALEESRVRGEVVDPRTVFDADTSQILRRGSR